ncbi:MAG: hypothetical protein ACRCZ0_06975 [Cetobacterium sp.]
MDKENTLVNGWVGSKELTEEETKNFKLNISSIPSIEEAIIKNK